MAEKSSDLLLSNVLATVRASAALSAQDVDFFRSLDSGIAASLGETSSNILGLINEILLSVDENGESIEEGKEGLNNAWRNISEVMDTLFEKSDHSLASMRRKDETKQNNGLQYLDDSPALDQNLSSKRIEKPQLYFKTPVDNSESLPFKPLLNFKPHSLKPLSEVSKLLDAEESTPSHYPQPYEYEISNQKYDDSVLQISEPIPSQPWEGTEAIWVDSPESLATMLEQLRSAKELAVDLEHHDYRSYYGITCLMQISTREQDWLVDTIALREELQVLNEVFTDPSIVKVFHGAFMDIIWLQRDLGLYIVGLFDTYHASRLLGFPRHSLAYLLERIAHFKTSKKYQLADWRIRPLSKPLKAYARADTHFLLNIYDHLRNSLIEQNKLAQALSDSRNVAKRRFEYTKFKPTKPSSSVFSPIEREDPWRNLMYQYNIPFSKEQITKKLYEWRDNTARKDDESPRYVMPNQLLVSLVILAPTEPAAVMSVSNFVTDHVRANSKVISNLIKKSISSITSEPSGDLIAARLSNNQGFQQLSTDQIEEMLTNYDLLAKKMSYNKPKGSSLSDESMLFHGNPAYQEKVISYSKKGKIVLGEDDLDNRKETVFRTISEAQEPAAFHVEVQKEKADEPILVNCPVEQPESPKIEETLPKFDKNEIIVLRERRQATKPKKNESKQAGESSKDLLDFNSADKVLNERSNLVRSKPSKRKFDPYSSENVGPQVMKKRKNAQGKQSSFKR